MGKGAGSGGASLVPAMMPLVKLSDGTTTQIKRSFNFCAGPAMLDSEVMAEMWSEFLSWRGSGVSLIEMSQRDKGGPVQTMIASATDNVRRLLRVPSNYKILLFQGGAHGQFAAAPLNLCGKIQRAQYVDGGFWSERAMREGMKYAECTKAAQVLRCPAGQLRYPDVSDWNVDPTAAYIHIVSNETIQGVELGDPDVGAAVLVADMTSTLLSRPVDVSKYGVIYASGGKNLGPAGVCVVIVREDLLDEAMPIVDNAVQVPSILSWKTMEAHENLYNTQCTFAIWAMKSVTDRLLQQGGLEVVRRKVELRSAKVYAAIDSSAGFYVNDVAVEYRSRTSVPFRIEPDTDRELEKRFIREADAFGLHQLSGHHTTGGLRVCVYNGIPDEALDALLFFMSAFQQKWDARFGR